MSYENTRKHSYSNPNQDPQPVPKKFRSQNDQCLNFADPPENIFNSLKIPRKTEGLQRSSQISSSNDTVSSVIPPPIPAFQDNSANVDKPVEETALDSLKRKLDKPTPKVVKQYYRCKECQLFLSSQSTLDAHLAGARHAKKLKELGICAEVPAHDLKKEKVLKLAENEYKCKICDVLAGSLIQIKSHIDGNKHKKKMKAYKDRKKLKKESNKEAIL